MGPTQRGPGRSLKSAEPGLRIAFPADASSAANTKSQEDEQGGVVDLGDLARRINGAHDQVKNALKSGLEHAIEAGRLLLAAKEEVQKRIPHGGWLSWLEKNCTVSNRTAQVYMQVARNCALVEGKYADSAHLPVSGFLKKLAKGTSKVTSGEPTHDHGAAAAREAQPVVLDEQAGGPAHEEGDAGAGEGQVLEDLVGGPASGAAAAPGGPAVVAEDRVGGPGHEGGAADAREAQGVVVDEQVGELPHDDGGAAGGEARPLVLDGDAGEHAHGGAGVAVAVGEGEDVELDGEVAEPEELLPAAPKRKKLSSRVARWADACERAADAFEELQQLKEEYQAWLDNMPESMQGSVTAGKLEEITSLDFGDAIETINAAADADLPLGFGRD